MRNNHQMDVEHPTQPVKVPQVINIDVADFPQEAPKKVMSKPVTSSVIPPPTITPPTVDIKEQVKQGFQPSSKIDKSRSRSRSNEKVAPVKVQRTVAPKKKTPSELS